jgi:hypothetical protein
MGLDRFSNFVDGVLGDNDWSRAVGLALLGAHVAALIAALVRRRVVRAIVALNLALALAVVLAPKFKIDRLI